MFLQTDVPSDGNRCLQIFWGEYPEQNDTLLGRKFGRLVQITLFTNWRKIMQSTTKSKRNGSVRSQIPETDRSTKAEPKSSSILGLNRNLDTNNFIVSHGTEQEVPAKFAQRIVLSIVSAVFDSLCICSSFTIRMRFLIKTIWAALGQAWDKKLSAVNSKLFID